MAAKEFDCPHCGGPIGAIPLKNRHSPNNAPSSNGIFQSQAPSIPPQGKWHRFFWFMRGNKPYYPVPDQEILTIRYEAVTKNGMKIGELDRRIQLRDLKLIANAIITRRVSWSRENLRKRAGVKPHRINIISKEFQKLGYLQVDDRNHPTVTEDGLEFLRGLMAA